MVWNVEKMMGIHIAIVIACKKICLQIFTRICLAFPLVSDVCPLSCRWNLRKWRKQPWWIGAFPPCNEVAALAGLWCATRGRLPTARTNTCTVYCTCGDVHLRCQIKPRACKSVQIISKHAWLVQRMKVIHRDGSDHTTPLGYYILEGPCFQLRITSK